MTRHFLHNRKKNVKNTCDKSFYVFPSHCSKNFSLDWIRVMSLVGWPELEGACMHEWAFTKELVFGAIHPM